MLKDISKAVDEGIRAVSFLRSEEGLVFIEKSASMIASCYEKNGKLLIAGNGGSLCDAAHFAEELTGQFRKRRKALGAIALADPGHLTCVGNDMGFEEIFSRGVAALGRKGDIFIALSTSGNSQNLINAVLEAKRNGLGTISFLGKSGGRQKGLSDLELLISGFDTSDRIQEAHMCAIHIIIEMVENLLFYKKSVDNLAELFS